MGDLDTRTLLITGANTGIGRETARARAGRGARVFFACRSEAKARPVIEQIAAPDALTSGSPPPQALDALDLTGGTDAAREQKWW